MRSISSPTPIPEMHAMFVAPLVPQPTSSFLHSSSSFLSTPPRKWTQTPTTIVWTSTQSSRRFGTQVSMVRKIRVIANSAVPGKDNSDPISISTTTQPIPPTPSNDIIAANKTTWARLKELLSEVWFLSKSFWTGSKKKEAWLWTLLTLVLAFATTLYAVLLSFVQRMFWTALSTKNKAQFSKLLQLYMVAVIIGPIVLTLFDWAKAKLSLMWREFLTKATLDTYLHDLNFYKIQYANGKLPPIDNPDQRISEDIRTFTTQAVQFLCTTAVAITDLIVFSIILFRIHPPLFYSLLAYSVFGTVITVWRGEKLIGLNSVQLSKEADFRYSLVRVRENSESIAFYRGSTVENQNVTERFLKLFANSLTLIGFQRNLGFFTTSYKYWINLLPSLVVAPIYFAGKIQLGVISQSYFSFNHVLHDLSLVVNQFSELSTFSAGVRRLHDFRTTMDKMHDSMKKEGQILVKTTGPNDAYHLYADNLTLVTPGVYKRKLVENLTLSLVRGERVLVTGQSGVGKTSLMRALAGLWIRGSGTLYQPDLSKALFLPQRPYLTFGSVKANVVYPKSVSEFTDEEVMEALRKVNLPNVCERLGGLNKETANLWSILSLGEQQRLAFARILLNKPEFIILDESSSALDEENEIAMYELVKASNATVISVSNRRSLVPFHTKYLNLAPDGTTSLQGKNADPFVRR